MYVQWTRPIVDYGCCQFAFDLHWNVWIFSLSISLPLSIVPIYVIFFFGFRFIILAWSRNWWFLCCAPTFSRMREEKKKREIFDYDDWLLVYRFWTSYDMQSLTRFSVISPLKFCLFGLFPSHLALVSISLAPRSRYFIPKVYLLWII